MDVSCLWPVASSCLPGKGSTLVRQGCLHVFRDRVVWRGHGQPEMTFRRGEWVLRPDPSETDGRTTAATRSAMPLAAGTTPSALAVRVTFRERSDLRRDVPLT